MNFSTGQSGLSDNKHNRPVAQLDLLKRGACLLHAWINLPLNLLLWHPVCYGVVLSRLLNTAHQYTCRTQSPDAQMCCWGCDQCTKRPQGHTSHQHLGTTDPARRERAQYGEPCICALQLEASKGACAVVHPLGSCWVLGSLPNGQPLSAGSCCKPIRAAELHSLC